MELTVALVEVHDPTDVAEARRRAADVMERLGFDEATRAEVAIVVTEAGTNLLKHAGGGQIIVGVSHGNPSGLHVVAMDRGSGIANTSASMRDGSSTVGTAGTGLGAMKRLATAFDVYSTVGRGTVLSATFYPGAATEPPAAGVSVPAPREVECGDGWAVWSAGELTSVFVADGLGHGSGAASASGAAVVAFLHHAERSAEDVIGAVHNSLKSSRGAAVAVAELDHRHGVINYCGLGNISALTIQADGTEQHLVSLSGIAGHVARRLQTFTQPWLPGSLLLMHSDGIGTHWSMEHYPGLTTRHPGVIAGVLVRDHRRGSDDATVVAAHHLERSAS